jgi:all-trans-retinol 13,14-reductase
MVSRNQEFDAIVAGSGIGGLTAAAALAKRGERVLVVEKHCQIGGLLQTFVRQGYRFATGLHYVGGLGDSPGRKDRLGQQLRWLTSGQAQFASVGSPCDVVRLPGFEFPIEAPRAAFVAHLKQSFPGEAAAIDHYFATSEKARRACLALLMAKALPFHLGALLRRFGSSLLRRIPATAADAVAGFADPRLAAVLCARWANHGLCPRRAPFAVHALVMESLYGGAYYPVGGPARLAEALAGTVTAACGELRTGVGVDELLMLKGRAVGAQLAGGETIRAPAVISALGARNTVSLLPGDSGCAVWRDQVESLDPSVSLITLYLGFCGDIRRFGATAANVWIYENDPFDDVWEQPTESDAPSLVVSFASLKDASHADMNRHTAEVMAFCRWQPFERWAGGTPGHRCEDYEAAKAWLTASLLAQFKRHFPRLGPLVDFCELSTPLSQAWYVDAHQGAAYGVEFSLARLLSPALRVRTPVPGLLLAGQDGVSPGIHGAFMGGFAAAATLEPRLWRQMV